MDNYKDASLRREKDNLSIKPLEYRVWNTAQVENLCPGVALNGILYFIVSEVKVAWFLYCNSSDSVDGGSWGAKFSQFHALFLENLSQSYAGASPGSAPPLTGYPGSAPECFVLIK